MCASSRATAIWLGHRRCGLRTSLRGANQAVYQVSLSLGRMMGRGRDWGTPFHFSSIGRLVMTVLLRDESAKSSRPESCQREQCSKSDTDVLDWDACIETP